MGRRLKLLVDINEKKGSGKLKEEALHHTLWTLPLDEFVKPFVRQTTK